MVNFFRICKIIYYNIRDYYIKETMEFIKRNCKGMVSLIIMQSFITVVVMSCKDLGFVKV